MKILNMATQKDWFLRTPYVQQNIAGNLHFDINIQFSRENDIHSNDEYYSHRHLYVCKFCWWIYKNWHPLM